MLYSVDVGIFPKEKMKLGGIIWCMLYYNLEEVHQEESEPF